MFTDALPPRCGAPCARLVERLMLLVCAFVVWYGTRLCLETMGQTIAELPWLPVGVTYLADAARRAGDAAVRARAHGVRPADRRATSFASAKSH